MKFIWPISLVLFSLSLRAAANPEATAFDGTSLTIVCHEHIDANVRAEGSGNRIGGRTCELTFLKQ